MDWDTLLQAAETVLLDKRVIGTAIAVLLIMNFGAFVANYVKKEPKPKVKRVKTPPPPPKPEKKEGEEGEENEEGEAEK